jgi:aspartate beta-hydroxylase
MTPTATAEPEITGLLEAAEKADAGGNPAEAVRLLERARSLAPRHPAVLNALGMHGLRVGEFAAARGHLEEAARLNPQSAPAAFHLALACRAQADGAAELAALDRALQLDPYFYLALFQKAILVERQRGLRMAAPLYKAFLACLPPGSQQAAGLRPAIERARHAIAANRAQLEEFIHQRIAATQARHGGSSQHRFDHCLDALLEKRRIYTPQPTLMHFPMLPALEFYERDEFPWLSAFEAATEDIRAELLHCLSQDAGGVTPYVDYSPGSPLNQWAELNRSRRWGSYYLIKAGVRVEEHLARCPKTAALLAAAPLADVPGQAPTAFFSILEPHTRIPPHTGVTNTRLVVHLPLVLPPGCGFRVGSEVREWRLGHAWVFDDTMEHEAWNDSDQFRAILIVDIWNPFLTAAERELVSATTAALSEYYHE